LRVFLTRVGGEGKSEKHNKLEEKGKDGTEKNKSKKPLPFPILSIILVGDKKGKMEKCSLISKKTGTNYGQGTERSLSGSERSGRQRGQRKWERN